MPPLVAVQQAAAHGASHALMLKVMVEVAGWRALLKACRRVGGQCQVRGHRSSFTSVSMSVVTIDFCMLRCQCFVDAGSSVVPTPYATPADPHSPQLASSPFYMHRFETVHSLLPPNPSSLLPEPTHFPPTPPGCTLLPHFNSQP